MLGRRFRSLKLWATLRCFGREGLQAMIREHIRLAQLFEAWVRGGARLGGLRAAPFSVVCFRPKASDEENEAMMRRVNEIGRDLPLPHQAGRALVLRLAIGNARTSEDDVRLAWDVLRREAAG